VRLLLGTLGSGSDGAVGLSRIKEQGGVTLVQAPEDAEFDGMPRAAIETGMIDRALPGGNTAKAEAPAGRLYQTMRFDGYPNVYDSGSPRPIGVSAHSRHAFIEPHGAFAKNKST
jgi:two-component system, chemotaxis family, CheB/CheR fusion protein